MKHSELFASIEALVPTLGGWSTPEKCCEFASIIVAMRPKVTVELGTWMGRGALSMAMAHRFVGVGKVWVVDPWSGKDSVAGQDGKNAEWWADQAKHELAYKTFKDSLNFLCLEDWVHVQRATSEKAEVPMGITALVIDGNHGPQAVKDVERWVPRVVKGGIIYLDDLNWTGGAVAAAGKRLAEMHCIPLYQRDEGMFYQKVK